MQLSIIIVGYNVRPLLAQCIASIKAAGSGISYEVIVVDNNSKDDTKTYFANEIDQVKFIWNKENIGFSAANNIGISVAAGAHVLFLNPDTIVTQDALQQGLSHISSTTNCGAVGVHMIDGAGNYLPESKRSVPGIFSSFFYFTGISKLIKSSPIFNAYHAGSISKNDRKKVSVLSGAFLMAEIDLIRKVDGFDPRFFMYAEDIDLCISIEKLGFKNWYLGDVKILHYKGESSIIKNTAYYNLFFSAMKLFVLKHSTAVVGKIKSQLISLTNGLFKLKYKLSSKPAKTKLEINHELTVVFCTNEERETIELFNNKYKFSKAFLFLSETAAVPNSATAVIYSTSLLSFSSIVEDIAASNAAIAKYIFNTTTQTIIGSNGKLDPAVVFSL